MSPERLSDLQTGGCLWLELFDGGKLFPVLLPDAPPRVSAWRLQPVRYPSSNGDVSEAFRRGAEEAAGGTGREASGGRKDPARSLDSAGHQFSEGSSRGLGLRSEAWRSLV